ncbi:MAG: PD40 domain-containing protein [Gemmatimonadetes bacterium]|nr:PD40 domain-containing protein [Gemmatimonadota bacterium]
MAFVSDRGPQTDFGRLRYSHYQITLLDVATGGLRALPLFANVDHINPQFSADGTAIYFLSDQDGFSDVYRARLDGSRLERITQVATAVSGVTRLSPAFTVARDTPMLVLSVFEERGFNIYAVDEQLAGTPVQRVAAPPHAVLAMAGIPSGATVDAAGPPGETVSAEPDPAEGRMLPAASRAVR